MASILKGATLVEFEPASVEVADLRIEGGRIAARGPGLPVDPADEVIELGGKVVIPGLVCAHHHLYSALARGMPPPAQAPSQFGEILQWVWWRLDQALDLDAVEVSATVGAAEALLSGTTTLLDHHASPRAIQGSLLRVARGVNEIGLRGVLSYEVTDRHGAEGREAGLEETVSFQKKAKGRFRGLVGAHASFTLTDDALAGLAQAVKATGVGLHIHLAEDPLDEKLSMEQFSESPVARLLKHELLSDRSILAHAVHLTWPDLAAVIGTGAWIIHNPRSNMNNQVGYAPAGKFGARAALGTDGIGSDMFQEVQLAYFRSREAGQPIDALKYLANGHRVASQIFDAPIGPLREGAAADLVIMDYLSPSPLSAENLAGHLLYGWSSRFVESVMVDGIWRMWARRPLSVSPETLGDKAREAAKALWARMAEIPT